MKKIVFLLAFSLLFTGLNDLHSQNLKRFVSKKSNTASKAAGARLDNESDTLVVKGVNKGISKLKGTLFGTKSSSDQSGNNQGETDDQSYEEPGENEVNDDSEGYSDNSSANSAFGNALMGAMGMSGNVETKEQYEFDIYIQMEMSSYNKSGELDESAKYDTYNSVESTSYAMVMYNEGDVVTMIIDTENNTMLTLSESKGEKTGFAVAFDPDTFDEAAEEAMEENADENIESNARPKKTGKTKTILGYKCDEYFVEDQEADVRMWVADGLKAKSQKELRKNSLFGGSFFHAGYFDGMVLEYDIHDKESNEKMIMQVTDLDLEKKHVLSTRGYNIMSMGEAMEE
jgi:hypothetical protein